MSRSPVITTSAAITMSPSLFEKHNRKGFTLFFGPALMSALNGSGADILHGCCAHQALLSAAAIPNL